MSPPRPGPYNIVSRGPAGMFALTFRGEHAPCEVQPFRPGAPDQTWHVKPTGPDTMSIEPIIGDELECATLGEFVGIMPKNGAVWSIRSAPPEGEYTIQDSKQDWFWQVEFPIPGAKVNFAPMRPGAFGTWHFIPFNP